MPVQRDELSPSGPAGGGKPHRQQGAVASTARRVHQFLGMETAAFTPCRKCRS